MKASRQLRWVTAEALPERGVFGRDLNPAAHRRYLGRSMEALYWDAQQGLYPNALAALIPCLQAGGTLYLHLPESYPAGDPDHLRFLDWGLDWRLCQPRFNQRLRQMPWRTIHSTPPPEALPALEHQVLAILGKRGRGKSHLLRHCAGQHPQALWVSPFRPSEALPCRFLPPDEALRLRPAADFLAVDEAASIPPAQLLALTAHYPRYALASSEDGYEGQGRAFTLCLLPALKERDGLHIVHLHQPWRYPADALEDWAERVFLSALDLGEPRAPTEIKRLQDEDWQQEALLQQIYGLLHGAHYRSRPEDLKRFLDLPRQRFYLACDGDSVAGVLHAVYESALPPEMAQKVIAHQNRPRGRLVLQQLLWQRGDIRDNRDYWRISRIAVHPRWRRQGWGKRLLMALREDTAVPLGVSFQRQEALLAWWQRQGFREMFRSAKNHVVLRDS